LTINIVVPAASLARRKATYKSGVIKIVDQSISLRATYKGLTINIVVPAAGLANRKATYKSGVIKIVDKATLTSPIKKIEGPTFKGASINIVVVGQIIYREERARVGPKRDLDLWPEIP
jgi:hypothetical protein